MTDRICDKTELRELLARVENVAIWMCEMPCPYETCEHCEFHINDYGINGCICNKLEQICEHLKKIVEER